MDILTWSLLNHHRLHCRIFLWIAWRLLAGISAGVLINSKACEDALLDLVQTSKQPDCHILLGAEIDPDPVLSSIPPRSHVIIGGSKRESDRVRQFDQDRDYHYLECSIGTKDEAAKAIDFAVRHRFHHNLGILAQDGHCLRALGTFIQQLIDLDRQDVTLVPRPYLAPGREELPQSLKNLGMIIEAWKLWKYQQKGDVAKLDDIIKYVRRHSAVNSSAH